MSAMQTKDLPDPCADPEFYLRWFYEWNKFTGAELEDAIAMRMRRGDDARRFAKEVYDRAISSLEEGRP